MATVNENQQLVDQYVENLSKLDTQKIKTFKKIKSFCSELHQSIDKLESSLKEQIDMEVVRQKSKLKDTIADLQNDDLVLYQTFKKIAVDVALDRSLIQSIQTLGKVQVNVSTPLSNQVKMKENDKDGFKNYKMGSTIFRVSSKFKLHREGAFVNTPVHGTFLPSNDIIFAVSFPPTGQLLVYNQKGEHIQQIHLTSFPHSVAVLRPSLVCVTFPSLNSLEFRDLQSLVLKRTVKFPNSVSGIDAIGENLVVACADTGFLIVDKNGETVKSIPSLIKAGYLNMIDNNIFYLETRTDKLFCYNSITNKKIFETEIKFGNLNGIAILRDKSLLVSMFRTGKNNITRVSADGTNQVKQTEFLSLSWPSAIGFDKDNGKLFIVHGADQVSVYAEK